MKQTTIWPVGYVASKNSFKLLFYNANFNFYFAWQIHLHSEPSLRVLSRFS